ncbi:hypothetical protein MAR_018718 [Mya arenaria]|uniref:Uncharacterized protein n=1 Tax=Mya arenaria TaxID=6604 RepID=A0ABY7EFW0_MYAAR|nr:hypothetical protein MAR_018718 [Mya arenaria]
MTGENRDSDYSERLVDFQIISRGKTSMAAKRKRENDSATDTDLPDFGIADTAIDIAEQADLLQSIPDFFEDTNKMELVKHPNWTHSWEPIVLKPFQYVSPHLRPSITSRDGTQREDIGWDVVEGTDEDGELSRLDTRIKDFLSGSMCDDNDESMQAPDEYMNTDDCRCKTTYMSLFDLDRIQEHILSVREMEKSEKDLYVMGSLQKFAHENTKGGKRKRIRYRYVYDLRNEEADKAGIRISGPRDDVCQTCELLRKKIVDAVLEQDKLDASSAFLEHVEVAQPVRTGIPELEDSNGAAEEILLLMCLVDSGFANIKKLFRRCDVDSLAQLAEKQTNCRLDWKSYLQLDFLPVRGIQKYHSFRFCKADSSAVYIKWKSGEPEGRVQLMKRAAVLPQGMPNTVTPAGLTAERRRYLRMHVRQYV